MTTSDLGAELQDLARRLASLTAAEREQLGTRAVAGLEVLVDRGQELTRLVVLGRALEGELANVKRVARLATAKLGRLSGPGP